MHTTLGCAAAVLCLGAGLGADDEHAPSPAVLTRAQQVRDLTAAEVKRGHPVRLRAVVTYYDPVGPNLFVQDATAGVWVDARGLGVSLRTGQSIDLQGVVDGGFAPYVGQPRWTVLGPAPLPSPRPVSFAEMATGEQDSQWVEVEGVVRRFVLEAEGRVLVIDVGAGSHQFKVRVPGFAGPFPMDLVDARVRFQGVSGAAFNRRNQLVQVHLFVPSLGDVRVLDPAPADPFARPVRPIEGVQRFSPRMGQVHRVKVRGTVTFQAPGESLFITDETGGMQIQTDDGGLAPPGTVVEAVGFPASGGYTPVLQAARFRPVGAVPPPSPIPVTAAEALRGGHDAELVQVEGQLEDDTRDAAGRTLVLRDGSVTFEARLGGNAPGRPLRPQSRLQVAGICAVKVDENGTPASFVILLRGADDLRVLAAPRWSRARTLGLLGALSAALLIALVWVTTLRRRLGEQNLVLRRRLEALRVSEERFETLFRSSPLVIAIAEMPSGRLRDVNERATDFFGYTKEEMVGRTAEELALWVDDAERANSRRALQAGEEVRNREARFRRRSGEIRHALVSVSLLKLSEDAEASIVVILIDVTEQKNLEDQLRQSHKMEAVGRLAGGIAHDFNNLLGVISGYGELMSKDMPPADRQWRRLEQIRLAADRATALTRQLLAFSRKQILQPRVLDLDVVIANLEPMLRRLIGEDVQLVTELGGGASTVFADPGQMEQVIMNLAVNSRDAMPKGGRLVLETAAAALDGGESRREPAAPPGRYVLLSVSDTGIGMDADTRAHAFEPFFTTKPIGQGTGLGLSTVYGIVRQSGGYVSVESEPGKGTTFRIYMPRREAQGRPAVTAAAEEGAPGGEETILLVEDERALKDLNSEVLRQYGYRVIEAVSGEKALEIAAEHMGGIDLLLTDVVMPGLSGSDLARGLRASRPATKILYMSGYPDDALVHHGVSDLSAAFIEKPFAPAALARKVREVLDS